MRGPPIPTMLGTYGDTSCEFVPPGDEGAASTTIDAGCVPCGVHTMYLTFNADLSTSNPNASTHVDNVTFSSSGSIVVVAGADAPVPPVRYMGLHRGRVPVNETSVSAEVMSPIIMGPRVISGDTSVWYKVLPRVAGKDTPGTSRGVRTDPAVAGPSFPWVYFRTKDFLPGAVWVTDEVTTAVEGRVALFS